MRFLAELRARFRHIIGPVLGVCAIVYIGYHAIQGDRGIIAYWRLVKQVDHARLDLNDLSDERARLDNRVRLLHPQSLDRDLLEERARVMLGYGREGERVILNEDAEKPPAD